MQKYSNVIYAMEVGFVGYWGEEHNSTYGNNTIANMSAILQAEANEFGPYVTLLERDPVVLMALEPSNGPLFGTHDDRLAGDATDADTWKNKPTSNQPTSTPSRNPRIGRSRSSILPFTGIFGTYYPTIQNCQDLAPYFAQIHLAALNISEGDKRSTPYSGLHSRLFYTVGPQISCSQRRPTHSQGPAPVHLTLTLTNYGYSRLM